MACEQALIIRMRVPHPTDVFETSRGEFRWGSGTNNDSEARALGDLLEMLIGVALL